MLWIDFVNSHARDPLGRKSPDDRLADDTWLRDLARRWELPPPRFAPQRELKRLRALRQLLWKIVRRLQNNQQLTDAQLRQINRLLRRGRADPVLLRQPQGYRLEVVAQGTAIERWQFAIARSFAETMAEGKLARLKTCANEDCNWVFYDSTRSRTRRWCATSCGDLIKVREFRERKKEEGRRKKAVGGRREAGG